MSGKGSADWTKGAEAIVYQSCDACGGCNISAAASALLAARRTRSRSAPAATGTVYATSLVCRAATPETRAHIPYNIVLVDTAEGFRMMAHGDNDLAIGDKVTARFPHICRPPGSLFRESEIDERRCEVRGSNPEPTRNC